MNGQKLLDSAIFYERRKNWKKAILFYNDLFELFNDDAFVNLHKHAPEEVKILKFQCYYHCGVAHQNLKAHTIAISMFQQAIRIVEARKGLCGSGCVTRRGVHWSVPAYAKQVLSQIYLGNFQEALQSSEKAVLLDNTNPDMYCIRAIVEFMLGDKNKATADATHATKLNPVHVCALILRGWFENAEKTSPVSRGIGELHKNSKWNKFEEKAYELNPSVVIYFGIADNKEKIVQILDKYLPTVRCPHTVTVYDVLQIVHAKRKTPERKSQIFESSKNTVYTRETSLSDATNGSTSFNSCETRSQRLEKRTFLSSGGTPRDILSANNHSIETEAKGNKISNEMTELSECCKGCSSVEEFLKHLIWNEDMDSESFGTDWNSSESHHSVRS